MPIRPIDPAKGGQPVASSGFDSSAPRRRIVIRPRVRPDGATSEIPVSPETSHSRPSDASPPAPAAQIGAEIADAHPASFKRRRGERIGQNWNGDGSYKVGKGKPPTSHHFPKGMSGNPKGRPKGSRSVNSVAADIFDVKMPVKVGGQTKMLDATGVMLTKLYEQAVKGKLAAIAQILAIQRERHPEQVTSETLSISPDEARLIDELLSKAGFGAAPVSRVGQPGHIDDDFDSEEEEA